MAGFGVSTEAGWRGRRAWTANDILDPIEYGFSSDAAPDPDLVVLDEARGPMPAGGESRDSTASESAPFDLHALDWNAAGREQRGPGTPPQLNISGRDERVRGIVHSRQRRARRRQIVTRIAIFALGLILLGLITLI